MSILKKIDDFFGALGRTRTGTPKKASDFKSEVSTIPPPGQPMYDQSSFYPIFDYSILNFCTERSLLDDSIIACIDGTVKTVLLNIIKEFHSCSVLLTCLYYPECFLLNFV